MALLNSGTIIAIDEETVIGAGQSGVWIDGDVVPFQDDSGLTPATASLERNNFNGSFIACQSLAGDESTSGSLNVELSISGASNQLLGHLLFKNTLGKFVDGGADVTTVAGEISESTGEAYSLYALATPTDTKTSLAVREYLGGSGDTVLDHKGVVGDSATFNFSAGQIANVSFSVSGTGYSTASGQSVLTTPSCGSAPFVTKSATFEVDGVTVDAQDVSMTVSNTNVDRKAITSTGISEKVTTAKSVELSYTLDMVDVSAYTALKNNSTAKIKIELTNGASELHVYLPVVDYTEVSKSSDSGVLTLSISSSAYNDTNGQALYIATKA